MTRDSGDRVLFTTGPSRLLNLHYYFLMLIILGVAGYVAWRYPTLELLGRDMHIIGPATLAGLAFLVLLKAEIRRATHKYIVGENTVAIKVGVLSEKVQYIPYRQVERVELDEGILGRIFNFGNLIVDTGEDNVVLRGLKGPQRVQKVIMERIGSWGQSQMAAPPPPPRPR